MNRNNEQKNTYVKKQITLALLELLKLGKAHVRQNGTFDRIMLAPGRREEETDGAE